MTKTKEQNREAKKCWKEKYPDHYKASYTRYDERKRQENPTHRMDAQRKRLYDVSPERYQILYKEQNGLCDICHQPELTINPKTNKPFTLALDHNHKTKQIRGLLCSRCNKGLGVFKDNPELLDNAVTYLRKWSR